MSVAPGTYNYGGSQAELVTGGTSGSYINLTCQTRGACIIENSVTGNSTVLWVKNPYVNVNGFTFTNTSSSGNNLGIYISASYVSLTQNTIHGIETDCTNVGGGGIQIASGSPTVTNITLDSNMIYDISMPNGSPKCNAAANWTDGIIAETTGNNIVITNNIIYWTSGGWGVLIGPGNGGGGSVPSDQVSNNLIFSTARGGIVFLVGGVVTTNNIMVDNGTQTGACAYQNVSGLSEGYADSEFYNNNGGNYCTGFNTGTSAIQSGDKAVDPSGGTIFSNWQANGSGNYSERQGSPTIDAGSTAGSPPSHDYMGAVRPQGSGSGYDIGPYQYSQ